MSKAIIPHPGVLTIGALAELIEDLKNTYPIGWQSIPVFIGNDEELNGVHPAVFADSTETWDPVALAEIINGTCTEPIADEEEVVVIS